MGSTSSAHTLLSSDGTHLSISSARYVNKEDADIILQTIRTAPKLEVISLDNLNLAAPWMEPIVEAIAACSHIRRLSLSGNPLSPACIRHLTAALHQWPQLEALGLERTQLTGKAVKPLCAALTGKQCLRQLNLSNNALKHAGADVADLIGSLPALRHLELEDCQLTPAAVERFADRLATAGGDIVTCSLHYNHVPPETAEHFTRRIIGARHRNLIAPPLDDDMLRAYCGDQLEKIRSLISHLPDEGKEMDATFRGIPTPLLAEMDTRLPALEAKTYPQELVPSLTAFLDSLPRDSSCLDTLTAADGHGYTPLDSPRTWLDIGSWQDMPPLETLLRPGRDCESLLIIGLARDAETVIAGLNTRGIRITESALRNKDGSPSPVMQRLLDDGTAPLLFTADNWRGETPQAMQRIHAMLPEEQRAQVTNYYTLHARLGMEQPRTARGR